MSSLKILNASCTTKRLVIFYGFRKIMRLRKISSGIKDIGFKKYLLKILYRKKK